MKRLGISIYPEHTSNEDLKKYLDKCAKLGFKRIFTCLLSADGDVNEIKETYREIIMYANTLGFETILDVAPNVFKKFGITYNNLSFFKELGAKGFRLDEGFSGFEEAAMTYNKQNLQVEVNASVPSKYIDNILSLHPNRDNFIACHNFYPQRYTGLGYDFFYKTSKKLRDENIQVAAFVGSQNPTAQGPWPLQEGLATLEMHRDLPIDLQARHLFFSGVVNDVIISNTFPTDEELESLAKINPNLLSFKIDFEVELCEGERKVIFEHDHHVRPDMSEYMVRSTMPRITYKDENIPAQNTRDIKRGDVIIVNNNYGRYKGELHIALRDMKNEGNKNVVGKIKPEELFLLDYLEPSKLFEFIK